MSETAVVNDFIRICGYCGLITYYDWVTCPFCDNWAPPNDINLEVNVSIQYEICPLCGGYRWKWQPFDIGSDYSDTDASETKPCGCPPEVRRKVKVKKEEEEKERQPQIIVCPNCNQELCIFLEEKDERLLHT